MRIILIILIFSAVHIGLIGQSSGCSCCTSEYRQFDFWLGDWEAFTTNGKLAGTNNIVLLQDSCIMQENWASASSNYTGTSYNYFDKLTRSWNQIWIDNQGSSLVLRGHRKGNQMILSSAPSPNSQGQTIVNRITWTDNPDGSVRQLWETSQDQKEWTAVFDGLYKKKSRNKE